MEVDRNEREYTDREPPNRAPARLWALAGVLAAACGLAVGELVAGFASSWRSPVVLVGDRVIDGAPTAVKDWAIDVFGTADKAVLVGGILVLLTAAAAGIGVLARRRGLAAALVGVAAVAAVGVLASFGRGEAGADGIVPALAAGAAAGAALWLLADRLGAMSRAPADQGHDAVLTISSARRQFLGTAVALGAGAAVVAGAGRWLAQRGVATAERLRVVLPRPGRPLPPVPEGAAVGVEGVAAYLTPNDSFFRIDTALTVPQVDPTDWTLSVVGDVDRELRLTYEELLERPMVEADITLACVSNEVGGDLVGTARWLGCRLDDLLDEAGIDPRADQVVGRSVDGFTAGFPTALLDGRDALVAIGMNGEPLPIRHGFPARLVVPGVYGYVSATKWLSEIELTRFDEFEAYWIPRGWSAEGPIKTQSRIDVPRSGSEVPVGEPVAVAGVAWAPTRGISTVEVRIDDGPWRAARLGDEHVETTWRQWVLEWTPTPGRHEITVRATDGGGDTQPEERTPVAPDGATGWHSISVRAA